jgi:phage gp45-like
MSSETNNTTEEWREQISSQRRSIAGMVRRMAITLTNGGVWRAIGHLLLDSRTREARDAEVFGGIGFAARPKAGANAEAIVVFPGGSSNPVIIATRDEDARRAVASLDQDSDQDSTAMFNRSTIILIKPDGTVEIRASGGTATKLPTLADYNALRSAFNSHVHATAGTGPPVPPTAAPGIPVATPAGTTVLKAQ